jgi:hypothetical protein
MRTDPPIPSLVAIGVAAALAICTGDAWAYCRTLTCPPPMGYPIPTTDAGQGACTPPSADFESYCAGLTPPVTAILPLWWRNACVSYDLQQDAGPGVPLATATTIVDTAFATWRTAACSTGTPSITPVDLGPVSCGNVEYNSDQGNQHVIVFRDDTWPHDDAYNTLGLTTVTYSVDSGEIYDADTEINATPAYPLSTLEVPLSGGYDFQSIITHEAGHFLGMAHATNMSATMYYAYAVGSTNMRELTSDDVEGICTIYPPNGTRTVDPSIDGGSIPEDTCDPTPRHGFSTTCAGPISHGGCAMSPAGSRSDGGAIWTMGFLGATAAMLLGARSRRRPS